MSDEDWVRSVLGFWFEELDTAAWFKKSTETDTAIRERFLATYENLAALDDDALAKDARTVRAAIIVLDQFPRNIFRNQPQAFATDAKALRLANAAVAAGLDGGLSVNERLFVYLPFEHSESLADQDRAQELVDSLGNEQLSKFATAHRDVIRRFGRFPHRNEILGRQSTAEEIAYLAEPGSGF